MHISYDIVCIIKKWGYDSEIFYLLLAYWFSNDKEKRPALEYLLGNGFSINLKEDISVYENFVQALRLFLSKSGYPLARRRVR